jgi:antitoxin (DNA-binding transcriptional repressor) of toxin-antitoxin stability system
MAATATIRELRNNFPRIRKLVEQEGEVVVTDQGTPKYRLTRFTRVARPATPAPKDYMARLRRHQTRALSSAAARALHDANRGER